MCNLFSSRETLIKSGTLASTAQAVEQSGHLGPLVGASISSTCLVSSLIWNTFGNSCTVYTLSLLPDTNNPNTIVPVHHRHAPERPQHLEST